MYRSSDTQGGGRYINCDIRLPRAWWRGSGGEEAPTPSGQGGASGPLPSQQAFRPQQQTAAAPPLTPGGEEAEVDGALWRSLDERMRWLEERWGQPEPARNSTRPSAHGDAAADEHPSTHHLVSRVEKLEAIVQRVLERMPIQDPVQQQTDQPSNPTASSPVILSTSPLFLSFNRHQPPVDSALEATSTTEAAPTEEEMPQRVTIATEDTHKKTGGARAASYSLGEELCQAAYEGRLEGVRRLLDSGTNINYINKSGQSPLISSFYFNRDGRCHPDVVSLLLERGADVNLTDMDGRCALHHAAILPSSVQCVDLLLAAGADVDARNNFGATPLMEAAMSQNEATVRALLAAGARKNVTGWRWPWQDMTAFDFAATDELRDLLRE
ncbi:Transient receptor potential channel pyrexia [Gryllus bimaculatus]|nr:Transient receptor potential channel pyrexia [Gryllus bimaculatus]